MRISIQSIQSNYVTGAQWEVRLVRLIRPVRPRSYLDFTKENAAVPNKDCPSERISSHWMYVFVQQTCLYSMLHTTQIAVRYTMQNLVLQVVCIFVQNRWRQLQQFLTFFCCYTYLPLYITIIFSKVRICTKVQIYNV